MIEPLISLEIKRPDAARARDFTILQCNFSDNACPSIRVSIVVRSFVVKIADNFCASLGIRGENGRDNTAEKLIIYSSKSDLRKVIKSIIIRWRPSNYSARFEVFAIFSR